MAEDKSESISEEKKREFMELNASEYNKQQSYIVAKAFETEAKKLDKESDLKHHIKQTKNYEWCFWIKSLSRLLFLTIVFGIFLLLIYCGFFELLAKQNLTLSFIEKSPEKIVENTVKIPLEIVLLVFILLFKIRVSGIFKSSKKSDQK